MKLYDLWSIYTNGFDLSKEQLKELEEKLDEWFEFTTRVNYLAAFKDKIKSDLIRRSYSKTHGLS